MRSPVILVLLAFLKVGAASEPSSADTCAAGAPGCVFSDPDKDDGDTIKMFQKRIEEKVLVKEGDLDGGSGAHHHRTGAGSGCRRRTCKAASPSPSASINSEWDEVPKLLSDQAKGQVLYESMLNSPADFLGAMMGDSSSGSMEGTVDTLIGQVKNPFAVAEGYEQGAPSEVYNPSGFCPLKSLAERLAGAKKVGGNVRKVAQLFNEFQAWIWSDGEKRFINPATDAELLTTGPLGSAKLIAPSWDDLRRAGMLFVMLPTLLGTDGGNRTTWFNQAAWTACWEPSVFGMGPMVFKYTHVMATISSPAQKRGYYTSTVPQHPDFFHPESPLMIDGDRHRSWRNLLELAGFSRRYPLKVQFAQKIPKLEGEIDKNVVAGYVGPAVMWGIWGAEPTDAATAAMAVYAKYGPLGIFGQVIHKVLGPAGIAAKSKAAIDEVTVWAKTTPFYDLLLKAREQHGPGNPWFMDTDQLVRDLVTATLFAGMGGTKDMTANCVVYQKRDAAHEKLFKDDPEKYLVELMRYDGAVTSVTSLLPQSQTLLLAGRALKLQEGTPVQMVLATANRDPTHWKDPNTFDPARPDLQDTLSWNGRVAAVEARSLEEAPRHCPGHCLSLKVAAATCAAMMGSFDELFAAGKLLQGGGTVKCNNFNPNHVEPPLWQPPSELHPPVPFVPDYASGEVLVKQGAECKSPGHYIASFDTIQECTSAVKAAGGKFFIYGTGMLKGGWCYLEYTTSASCPEGFESDSYDFYTIPEVPLEDALHCKVDRIKVSLKGAGSGYLVKEAYEAKPLTLVTQVGKVSHLTSLVRDMFCKQAHRINVHGGGLSVGTWKACCDQPCTWYGYCSGTCEPPEPNLGAAPDESVSLLNKGDSTEICSTKDDSTFVFRTSTSVGSSLPTHPHSGAACFEVSATSRIITLREAMNQCPAWIKVAISGLALASKAAYAASWALLPGDAHDNFVAAILGKDPESSALDPVTFDAYTVTIFTALVHIALKSASGSLLPVSKRISLPDEMRYFDRYTVYDFIGLPAEELDGSKAASVDPTQACMLDATREMDFADDLDTGKNTWARALGEIPGTPSNCPKGSATCTMKQFILGAFGDYTTADGLPVYPKEEINFQQLFRVDNAWTDGAEKLLAWGLWGQQRLEVSDVAGTAFMIKTTDLSGITVRPGFARVGADMYFDKDGAPVMIRTPDLQDIWKSAAQSVTWQYWKFAWRSSAFLKVTAIDHLWATHFTAANAMAGAVRDSLPPAHPLRRLLSMFTFGTISVNNNAFHQLLGPNALLQRSSPFHDFQDVAKAAKALLPSLEQRFGAFVSQEKMKALPKLIQETPFLKDGALLFDAIKKFVDDFFGLYDWCDASGLVKDDSIKAFWASVKTWSMLELHMDTDAAFFGLWGPDGKSLTCAGLQKWIAVQAFHVTGYHRQVGQVGDTASDPSFAGFSWRAGEAFTRPRQAIQLALISASTATKWPKLSKDYSHLAQGIAKASKAKQLFKNFQQQMNKVAIKIDSRNQQRDVPYLQMHPDHVECSVAV